MTTVETPACGCDTSCCTGCDPENDCCDEACCLAAPSDDSARAARTSAPAG